MLSFKDFILLETDIYNRKGILLKTWVDLGSHSGKRRNERVPNLTMFDIQDIFEPAIPETQKHDNQTSFLIYSTSKQQGIIVKKQTNSVYILVTILPKNRQVPKQKTIKIYVP